MNQSKLILTHILSLCMLSALLPACSGGSGDKSSGELSVTDTGTTTDDNDTDIDDGVDTDPVKPEGLDFYSFDFNGNPRSIRNDLSGSLKGQVQFAQSHTVDPKNNFAQDKGDETQSRYMPRLVALRSALLLFTPDSKEDIESVDVEVSVQGSVVGTYAMRHPYKLYRSDYEGPERIEYSHSAWNLVLPWDQIKNGLSLKFFAKTSKSETIEGELTANNIDIGEATQMVLQSIRLGMLTDPEQTADHYLLTDPEKGGTDYFQTLPISKLIIASYEDVTLKKVLLKDGTFYDTASSVEGSAHGGDMRENVAKAQVSTGINLANFGITSNSMDQYYPYLFKQITSHHAWGMYSNGKIAHGLSGGNGIGTLYKTHGNEASHEWGHAYGLGHYPGTDLTDDKRWGIHHANSGWGYIAHRKRMRSNLYNGTPARPTDWEPTLIPIFFKGKYLFNRDPMSGGDPSSSLSKYTHYTGYSARIIQNNLEQYPIPDTKFSSGYKKWDTQKSEYIEYTFPAPQKGIAATPVSSKTVAFPTAFVLPNNHQCGYSALDAQHKHKKHGARTAVEQLSEIPPAPKAVGVPVATLLGAYDPEGDTAIVYPVFHGNYGNVFDLPEPDFSQSGDLCWLTVNNAANQTKNFELAAKRLSQWANDDDKYYVNQFHVNLAADYKPTSAKLYCRRSGAETLLAENTFDGKQPAMKPAVIIGQEYEFSALQAVEMPELEQLLTEQDAEAYPSPKVLRLLNSYSLKDIKSELSATAWKKVEGIQNTLKNIQTIEALLNQQENDGVALNQRKESLLDLLVELELLPSKTSDWPDEGAPLNVEYDAKLFLSTQLNSSNDALTLSENTEKWYQSPLGTVHPSEQPWLCLTPDNSKIILSDCDWDSRADQSWSYSQAGLLQNTQSEQCINYDFANDQVIEYSCQKDGSTNEQWLGLEQTDHPLLKALPGKVLKQVYAILKP